MVTDNKSLVSIVLPAYNEEAIIEDSIGRIIDYVKSKESVFSSEVLVINDGSTDKTGDLADSLARNNAIIRVIHHPVNMNLGRALQTGFKNARGTIIVVLDIDLSYSVDHIEKLVMKQIETDADIVIASPYTRNGKVTGVPFKRAIMSRIVNRFMRFASQERYHTFTSMVRAYKSDFIKNLNLKTIDYEINPEIIYKAIVLRANIVEIPGHLDWSFQNKAGKKRTSAIRIRRGFFSGLMSGFIFRPYIFFFILGIFSFLLALYMITWIFINTFNVMPEILVDSSYFDARFSLAVAEVYKKSPHAFIVGGITLLLSIQILGLSFISLQSKRYFEELFHINSQIIKKI